MKHNLNEVVASLGCTVELQINNTRAAWHISTAPLRAVFKDLLVRNSHGQGLQIPLLGPSSLELGAGTLDIFSHWGHYWHFGQNMPWFWGTKYQDPQL